HPPDRRRTHLRRPSRPARRRRPPRAADTLAAQVAAAGFDLQRSDCRRANGRTDYTARTVTIRADVSDAQAAKTLAHELAHVLLHNAAIASLGCRGLVEVEPRPTPTWWPPPP